MAIYYVSPYTTTNGTGTWASPYSFNAQARTAFVAGDELRIVAKNLTDLLTATTYTVNWTALTNMTVVSGGGLGADFASGSLVYFPEYDSFSRVGSVSGNVLISNVWSYYNSTSGRAITMRRVDLVASPVSMTGTTGWLCNGLANNVTISDGWIADGVQVTDGTAKSIVRSGTTGSPVINLDVAPQAYSGVVYNIPNTHFLVGNSASASTSIKITAYGSTTYSIGQIYSTNANPFNTLQISNSSALPCSGLTFTVKNLHSGTPFGLCYATRSTFNITNWTSQQPNPIQSVLDQSSVNFTNILAFLGGTVFTANGYQVCKKCTYTINGEYDNFASLLTSSVTNSTGAFSVEFGSGSAFYSSRRVSTITSWTRFFTLDSNVQNPPPDVPLPKYILRSGLSVGATPYAANATSMFGNALPGGWYKKPSQYVVISPATMGSSYPYACMFATNVLVYFLDGTSPIEILGVNASFQTNTISTQAPIVSLDAAVFRTTGPSLKSYLSSRNTTYYNSASKAYSVKNIKIPVISGQSYTIAGYVRTDMASYATGDCRVSIVNDYAEITGQDITTACIGAWEAFSLTFTATQTEELNFAWEMYFAEGAKSIWLDDLTIT